MEPGPVAPAHDYLQRHPRLVAVAAEVQSQGESTSSSIGTALGRNHGSALRDLRKLEEIGVLESKVLEPSGSRPRQVFFSTETTAQVLEDLELDAEHGLLQPGTHLVLIPSVDLGAVARALENEEIRATIRWFAVMDDSSLGGMLALRGPTVASRVAALAGLRSFGLDARSVGIEQIVEPNGLEAWVVETNRSFSGLKEIPRG